MSSLNKVIVIGNVGKAARLSTSKDGGRIANFSVATSDVWKDKVTGERKEKTEWHRIVVLNDRIVDFVDKFVRQGSRVYIEGQLQTRKWTDNSGHDNYATEIIVGRFKGEILLLERKDTGEVDRESTDSLPDKATSSSTFSGQTIPDDDIPF